MIRHTSFTGTTAVILMLFVAHLWQITAMAFTPPTLEMQRAAIGDLSQLSASLRKQIEPDGDFAPIPVPGSSDWLAQHQEHGQTFDQYIADRPARPEGARRTLYILPLGDFKGANSPSLDDLQEFASAFFAMDVKLLAPIDISTAGITSRINDYTKNRQYLTGDILYFMKKRLPPDGFAMVAVTMEDLYPNPDWNFVFGQASLVNHVGVFSFARYKPSFNSGSKNNQSSNLMLRRSCKVLAHETAHMFGIEHCIYYHCLMNGSNNLPESDARPLHFCPVDFRKLQWNIGFDPDARYQSLRKFFQRVHFDDEVTWIDSRLKHTN